MSNIFNIPSNYNFLESIYEVIIQEYKNKQYELSNLVILLPSRRACNALKKIFIDRINGNSIALPLMKAIGDADYDDFLLENINLELLLKFEELTKPSHNLKYKLLLIQNLLNEFKNFNMDQAINLSGSLEQFLDEVNKNDLNLNNLDNIVDDDYAKHWQELLKFLKIFTKKWEEFLGENNIISTTNYKLKIIELHNEIFKNQKEPAKKIIIAGNFFKIKQTMELVKNLLNFSTTKLFLKGFDSNINEDEWKILNPIHSQYLFKNFIRFLNIDRGSIGNLEFESCRNKSDIYLKTIYNSTINNTLTYRWKDLEATQLNNLECYNCNDIFEEMNLILFYILNFLSKDENKNKNIGIIANIDFARKLEIVLKNYNLIVYNTFGNRFINNKIIDFLMLLVESIESDFEINTILSLLKNKFSFFGYEKEELNRNVKNFEKYVLRRNDNLVYLLDCKNVIELMENQDLKKSLKAFIDRIESYFLTFKTANSFGLKEYLIFHLTAAENIAKNEVFDFWNVEDDGGKIFEFLQNLLDSIDFEFKKLNLKEYLSIFKFLINEQSYSNEYSVSNGISLINITESKLIDYDLVFLTNLNDGDFPQSIKADAWMNNSMRAKFGLPNKEDAIGESYFDFIQILMQKNVVLTRSFKQNNSPTIKSRFLLRLETFLKTKKIDISFNEDLYNCIKIFFQQKNSIKLLRPKPTAKNNVKPNKLSATNIELFLKNPYDIYVKKILKLYPLNEISAVNNALTFGNAVHKSLEEFCINVDNNLDKIAKHNFLINNSFEIFKIFFQNNDILMSLYFPRFKVFSERFIELYEESINDDFKIFNELEGEMIFKDLAFSITAKADRIDINDDEVKIIDYKTGQIPSLSSIKNGTSLQTTIESLIFKNNAFLELNKFKKNQAIESEFWKFNGSIKKDPKIHIAKVKTEDLESIIPLCEEYLTDIIKFFKDENREFIATARNLNSNYDHLSRVSEWLYNI